MPRQQMTQRWNTLFLLFYASLLVAKVCASDPYGGVYDGNGVSDWGGPWNNYNGNGRGPPTPTSVNDNGNIVATSVVTTTAVAAYNGGGHGPNYGSGSGIGDNSGNSNGNGNGNGFGGSSSSSLGPGFDVQRATQLRMIHGILAAVAFVGLFPIGAVLVRVVPSPLAWVVHALTQTLAYVMFVAAAVLGLYLVSMVKIPPNGASLLEQATTNAHPIIGLVVLGVLTVQPALGLVHHSRYKRTGGRTWWSHAHIWAGRCAVTLGIVNGGIGLGLARASRGAVVAYAVVAAIVWLLWMLVAAWGEVRLRQRGGRQGDVGGETGRLRGGEEPKDGPDTEGAATGPSSVRSDIPRDGGDIRGTAATGGGDGGSTTTTVGGSAISAVSSSRVSNTTAEAEAAAAAIAASFLQQARPFTPSPPYTPGPAASTEWTIYGGPGLNNTPRGNHTEIPTQEPPKSG